MGHLRGVSMATPGVVSGAIVKLSNEKIRKYHLDTPFSSLPSFSFPPFPIFPSVPNLLSSSNFQISLTFLSFPHFLALSPFSLLSYLYLLFLSFPLFISFPPRLLDGRNNPGAFRRLPAVTGDGTTGRLVKWFELWRQGVSWGRWGGKMGKVSTDPPQPKHWSWVERRERIFR